MFCSFRHIGSEHGQATVEAAFLLPVLFGMLALLVQPMMLLYNRCVMQAAAAEGCRVAATARCDERELQAYVQRRLAAIPALDVFQDTDEGWLVNFEQDSSAGTVCVTVVNHIQPLPLVGLTAGLLACQLDDGRFEQQVSATSGVVPAWVAALGTDPVEWVGVWE